MNGCNQLIYYCIYNTVYTLKLRGNEKGNWILKGLSNQFI